MRMVASLLLVTIGVAAMIAVQVDAQATTCPVSAAILDKIDFSSVKPFCGECNNTLSVCET